MTFARARLYLGITGVGLSVLAALALLLLDLPERLLPTDTGQPVHQAVAMALAWPLTWTLLVLPLDLLGGLRLVRVRPAVGTWVRAWCRGVTLQFVVLGVAGTVLVVAARALGVAGVGGATLILSLAALAGLDRLAALGARLARRPGAAAALQDAGLDPARTTVVAAGDEGFVGGFGGVFVPRLVVPEQWYRLPRAVTNALLLRRALAMGATRRRGQAAAIGWVTLGAVLTAFALGPPTSAAALVRFSLGTTLWGFLGVLLLPTPSRWAVLALDRRTAARTSPAALAEGISALDRWQDDEPARARWVERIFHPVPSRDARLAVVAGAPAPHLGAWRVARLVLPLGLSSWGLLGRAVHCNVGRPALWWMLPGD